ncbi:putative glycolipid-binding domain-containing protein, partial [Streptomyces griseoincarnatus]
AFTPSTNTLAIRRLGLDVGGSAEAQVLWARAARGPPPVGVVRRCAGSCPATPRSSGSAAAAGRGTARTGCRCR